MVCFRPTPWYGPRRRILGQGPERAMRLRVFGRHPLLIGCIAVLAGGVVASMLALSQAPAAAQALKPWRNALIEPKADAGFFLMASQRGFFEKEGIKVDTLKVKDDTIG